MEFNNVDVIWEFDNVNVIWEFWIEYAIKKMVLELESITQTKGKMARLFDRTSLFVARRVIQWQTRDPSGLRIQMVSQELGAKQ